MLIGAVLCAFNGALLGCATAPPPVYLTTDLPEIPETCVSKATPEPKLNEKQPATDLDALKHVLKLKTAYRSERHLRKSCGEQLKAQRGQ